MLRRLAVAMARAWHSYADGGEGANRELVRPLTALAAVLRAAIMAIQLGRDVRDDERLNLKPHEQQVVPVLRSAHESSMQHINVTVIQKGDISRGYIRPISHD
jgi:hypothetical protein